MKYIQIFLAVSAMIALFTTGCDTGITDTPRQRVNKEFPNADIECIPNDSYQFIIRDTNGAIYYVYNFGKPTLLFNPPK